MTDSQKQETELENKAAIDPLNMPSKKNKFHGALHKYIGKNIFDIAVLVVLLVFMLFQLGSYPGWFDAVVEHMIHPQVNNVLDGTPMKEMTWKWTDMHQHGGGASPVYGWPVWLGLKIFGLSLFGVRIFTTLIAFFSIVLLYFSTKKLFENKFALVFVVLLATSPWYLINSRSGGIVGFGFTLVTLALSLLIFMLKKQNSLIIAFLAGISIGFLPYGHASTRAFAPLIIAFVIICFFIKKIRFVPLVSFIMGCFLLFLPQINTLDDSLKVYFYARGESLSVIARDNPEKKLDFNVVKEKLGTNIELTAKQMLTLNSPDSSYLWPNIANSYNKIDTILYPKFLMPFMVIGLLLLVINMIKRKNIFYCIPIMVFFVSLSPSLMSGIGLPNPSRDYLACLPIYFFIAYSFYFIGDFIYKKSYIKLGKKPVTISITFLVLISSVCSYQLLNFFTLEKGTYDEKKTYSNCVIPFVNNYLERKPEATIVIHEYAPFDVYGYVGLRWSGGSQFEKLLKDRKIILLRQENAEEIKNLINNKAIDLVVSNQYETVEKLFPTLSRRNKQDMNDNSITFRAYYLK
ncbi:ArnT family glycosyltransferase [Pseudobacteroides cellulosolvens]|uniref:Glycosyltransferase RgtA/B/C/D-like domain-containing protein n=1 Tax=Pseudobacteroides cellulosolvens ATCC 35603 = DSM 2933 TaxID=398512 RepID=A0A0L6JVK4_9FIRM|nr:glycosyltransferase family 39 protein [Pseudobacteroides cellulosolvens]KNY29896.1 hypothetical protein Bccel_5173 [Pseudobacteroides cellulosolvens ATCC 35603 = DSM 2933]